MKFPLKRFQSVKAWRIIPSRFPPVDLLKDVAPREHWDFLNQFEGRTNQRLVETNSPRGFVRPEDFVFGSDSHYILGPLTHPNPEGSLLADGSFGVLYAALEFETAAAEVKAQREEFLRYTSEPPIRLDMRVIVLQLNGSLEDLRGNMPANVEQSRLLGRKLREQGSYGVVFNSSANPGGTCIGIFRPPVLSQCVQERHLAFVWDGTSIVESYEYKRSEAS